MDNLQENRVFNSGLSVVAEFPPHIDIDVDFKLPDEEYADLLACFASDKVSRIHKEASLFFARQMTMRDIADAVGISKSQVQKDIRCYRDEMLKEFRQDISSNNRALNLLVGLITQTDDRIKTYYVKYDALEKELKMFIKARATKNKRGRRCPQFSVNNSRYLKSIIDCQLDILSQLRSETQQLLSIYSEFGLSNKDGLAFITSNGFSIDKKVEEVKVFLTKVIAVIKQEVENKDTLSKIFKSLAAEVQSSCLNGWGLNDKDGGDNEFRL